jgi:hypothetical protein
MPRKAATKPKPKPAPRKKAKPARKAKAGPSLPEGSTRALVFAGVGLLLTAGVVVGAGLGIPALGRNAARRISNESRTVQVWLTPPGWMPQETFDGVMDRAVAAYARASRDLGSREALSVEPLRAVQEAVATSGWALDAPRVSRRQPTRVEGDEAAARRNDVVIELAWRRPVAVVRSSAFLFGARPGLRDTAIDASATVLPMSGPPESFPNLRVILNPSGLPAPKDATDTNPQWPGQDVRDAIALLDLLAAEAFAPQIAGIDLAEHADGRRLLIVTTTGGRVVWGAPPGGEGIYRGEVPDESKLANLQSLVEATGQLDGGQERVEIHWPGTVLIGDNPGGGGRRGQP